MKAHGWLLRNYAIWAILIITSSESDQHSAIITTPNHAIPFSSHPIAISISKSQPSGHQATDHTKGVVKIKQNI